MRTKLLAVFLAFFAFTLALPANTYADVIQEGNDESCEKTLFGMRPWYAGLVTRDDDDRCVVGTPEASDEGLAAFTWTIVLNILFDLFAVLGLVSTGFIILGGYWYLRSGGDPTLVSRGKKTIQAAVIGTVIALVATLVTSFITSVLTSS